MEKDVAVLVIYRGKNAFARVVGEKKFWTNNIGRG